MKTRAILLFSGRSRGRLLLALLLFPLLFGCRHTEGLSVTVASEGQTVFTRIAVLPFREISPRESDGRMVSCPVCGTAFQAGPVSSEAASAIEEIFLERLRERKNFALISPDIAAPAQRRVAESRQQQPLMDILMQTGRELGADGILLGYVYRVREREGFPYSARKPASVAFDVHLIRVSDGVVVWRGSFDKTQTSLMEDLLQISFFYKLRGKWVTARELAGEGIAEMLNTFPGIL